MLREVGLQTQALRNFLQRDEAALTMVQEIFLGSLRKSCNPTATVRRTWTGSPCTLPVAFIYRFGTKLNSIYLPDTCRSWSSAPAAQEPAT